MQRKRMLNSVRLLTVVEIMKLNYKYGLCQKSMTDWPSCCYKMKRALCAYISHLQVKVCRNTHNTTSTEKSPVFYYLGEATEHSSQDPILCWRSDEERPCMWSALLPSNLIHVVTSLLQSKVWAVSSPYWCPLQQSSGHKAFKFCPIKWYKEKWSPTVIFSKAEWLI